MAAGDINPAHAAIFPPKNVYTQNRANQGQITIPSREFISNHGAVGDMALGANMTRAAYHLDVPWVDDQNNSTLYNAVKQLIGRAVPAGGGKIKRFLPIQHPEFAWLYAKNITSIKGVGPVEARLQKDIAGTWQHVIYKGARLVIEFWQPPYAVLQDGEVVNEWERYLELNIEPSGEFLAREKQSFVFNEGAASTNKFLGSRSQYVPKKRLKMIWHQVPEKGLFPNLAGTLANFSSPNLDGAVGKVNQTNALTPDGSWAGYIAETALCEAWGCEPVLWPLKPDDLGLGQFSPSRLWDVSISVLHFDMGSTVMPNSRGHNTFPYILDNRWYKAVSAVGAHTLYETYDFNKLFQLN